MNNKTKADIISFFQNIGYFKLKSTDKQAELFLSYLESFQQSFGDLPNDEIFALLNQHIEQRKKEREAKNRSRLLKNLDMPISAGSDSYLEHITTLPPGKYVLTAAQNNTDIDKTFFQCLNTFCEKNQAQLLVARITYNKNAFCQPDLNSIEPAWYDPAITRYLINGHISLDNKYHFLADSNVIPTARNPLTGFDSATLPGIHAIIPASKIALKIVAALKNAPTKILTSTGMITKRNYIMRKAGNVAALEHCISAVFIDTEADTLRHIELMQGEKGFYDDKTYYTIDSYNMDYAHKTYYTIDSCNTDISPEVLQLGDIHAEKMGVNNLQKYCELVSRLKPKHIILHDVLDFSSRNHHNIKDPTFLHVQHVNNQTVANDLKIVAKTIDKLQSASVGSIIHIIESNHDLAINTWLKNSDFKVDPVNAVTYLTCMLALYKHQEKTGNSDFNMLQYAYKQIGKGKNANSINFHKTDESLKIAGVEHGCHGHNGVNGSRGSPQQFRSLGTPMNTGHTHSPGIYGKVYTAGVAASLEMGYNLGASSWKIAHIVTYSNGQRQIIFGD